MLLARHSRLSSKPNGAIGTARGVTITVVAGKPQSGERRVLVALFCSVVDIATPLSSAVLAELGAA
jgi:hypothetical protein